MKRKNGFTLIELLAVIVILAIIALIAVPVVMNIINRANKSAFKDSAYGLLKAGENYYMDSLLNAELMTEDKTFTFPNSEGLEFQGSKPTRGTMTVRKDGKVSMEITNGKYCVKKGFDDEDVTIREGDCGSSNGGNTIKTLSGLVTNTVTHIISTSTATDVPPEPTTETVAIPECITNKTKCAAGTPVAVKVNATEIYKFFVLNDDEAKNEVTLIMDRNLGENVVWHSLSTNNSGPLIALKKIKERTSGWTNIPTYTYTLENDADGQGGSNTYNPITSTATAGTSEGVVENVRARLPRYSDINNHLTVNGYTPEWLECNIGVIGDQGYWLSTAASGSSQRAWTVSNKAAYGAIDLVTVDISISLGIRPVITLSK